MKNRTTLSSGIDGRKMFLEKRVIFEQGSSPEASAEGRGETQGMETGEDPRKKGAELAKEVEESRLGKFKKIIEDYQGNYIPGTGTSNTEKDL